MRLQRLQSAARLLTIVAAAAAAAFSLMSAVAVGQFALAAAVLAALLVRLQAPTERWRHIGAAGLVMAVAAVVGATGGVAGPAVIAPLLVMADYGLNHPTRTVILAGVGAAGLAVVAAVLVRDASLVDPSWIWALVLVPLAGVTSSLLGGRQSLEGTAALESATAALDEVLALAERIPAGFDRWSVATAVHLELLEASRLAGRPGPTPHLLLVQQGVLFGVGTPVARQPVGLLADVPGQRFTRLWTKVTADDLPPGLTDLLGHSRWLLHRLSGDGENGVVLVPHDIEAAALDAVSDVLRPAAVALANVERFERLEDVAISAARTRVAHDLHDGVAQALTHVRFELDLLALEHDELVEEINRIRGVADSALLEVRRTVGELRDSAPLADRIARHVELLSSFVATSIDLELPESLEVVDGVSDDVFRIVQEALSNVVRHARADTVRVTVTQDPTGLSVAIVDDGVGIDRRAHDGVGLGGMETRARRLGGELVIRPRRGGGTVVELEVPMSAAARMTPTKS